MKYCNNCGEKTKKQDRHWILPYETLNGQHFYCDKCVFDDWKNITKKE